MGIFIHFKNKSCKVDFKNNFICSNISCFPDRKKKIEMLVSLLKFVKIFFKQIYIKFAETQFDQTITGSIYD